MSKILISFIKGYQKILSPILYRFGVRCRFYPTCSEYMIMAIQQEGSRVGLTMGCKRLLRCRPDNWASCIDFPDHHQTNDNSGSYKP